MNKNFKKGNKKSNIKDHFFKKKYNFNEQLKWTKALLLKFRKYTLLNLL